MNKFTDQHLRALYKAPRESHKGQNGRLLIIGGSRLFHAASLWSLTVASRIVDLVHYSSVPENNQIVLKAKQQFRNGIVVHRQDVEEYIREDDAILIGPGMTRDKETEELTNSMLKKYSNKQWIIDAGALQVMDVGMIPPRAILTPHGGEFVSLLKRSQLHIKVNESVLGVDRIHDVSEVKYDAARQETIAAMVWQFAKAYDCVLLLKGVVDFIASPSRKVYIEGGNAGMTKGGTGDVLSGLIAALACKNDPFLAAAAGSFINKQAGDALYKTVGPYFNATDLANQIPITMKSLLYPSK